MAKEKRVPIYTFRKLESLCGRLLLIAVVPRFDAFWWASIVVRHQVV